MSRMRVCKAFISLSILVLYLCKVTSGINQSQGFIENPKDGRSYRLMYHAQTWTGARDSCVSIGAKLAVPKSKEQFVFIQRIVRSMHYPSVVGSRYKLLVWLGISNVDDNGTWKNVDGENIEDTGFHTWAGKYNGGTNADPKEPHCVGLDAMNIGLRDWWCHHRQPYICEKDTDNSTS